MSAPIIDQNTSRDDLERLIVSDEWLYATFDERRLLGDDYSTEEMREIVIKWAEAGDECK